MYQQRRTLDPRKSHFRSSQHPSSSKHYPYRLNFYNNPPTDEITLEQFEQWAIDRLKILGEIESCVFRNKSLKEMQDSLRGVFERFLPLSANSAEKGSRENEGKIQEERKKDHYSHFILRLAFARSEELRTRFSRAETMLFRLRFETDDTVERSEFIESLNLGMVRVSEEEKNQLRDNLIPTIPKNYTQLNPHAFMPKAPRPFENTSFYKVDWERVPDLVEQRRVFVKTGIAYVPAFLQVSLVAEEFTASLNKALNLTARALPRLDEDDRIIPILNNLSLGFTPPDYTSSSSLSPLTGEAITAAQIDNLTQYFPLCMLSLHTSLRRNKHLKHFGRLQYGLFLKGIGLSVDEALTFWRSAFSNVTDDKFNKEYRYNIRHSYGLEGNRRNYKPLSCQQILIERTPGAGENHGCPYRHFSMDNLVAALGGMMNVHDKSVIDGVKQDVSAKKYHIACNRVFDYIHAKELEREKEEGTSGVRETIIHPNMYFSQSFELKNKGCLKNQGQNEDVEMQE